MLQFAAGLQSIPAQLQNALRHTVRSTSRNRRRSGVQASHPVPNVENLEGRILLSGDPVATVGVYDENAVQTNTVDVVADGSSMTDTEFAARVATAFANNEGGVIDGAGHSDVFEFGQDLENALHIVSMDGSNWTDDTPTDRSAISGTTAFASGYSATYGGYNVVSQMFSVVSVEGDRQVLEFGVTVLGQTLEEYGTVYLYGHLAYGGDMLVMHQVMPGGTEDVFYGVTAPATDYFTGFSLAYAPEGEWIVDKPLWFDDFGFIVGDYTAGGNQAPTAYDDAYTLDENASLTTYANYGYPGNGVLANDVDPESHNLTSILVSGPANGTLDWNFDGGFTYTPDPDFSGTDSFAYKAHDGFDYGNVATVTLTVSPAASPPIAQDDTFTLDEDSSLSVAAPGVLSNDSDPDGLALSAAPVAGPSHGTLTLDEEGGFVYTPDTNFYGADSFTYQALAGGEESNVATVMLTVERVNAVPAAAADAYTLDENVTLSVNSPGVLGNDTDQDGEPLTAVLVGGPAHGALTFHADGSFNYAPLANFNGPVSFTYQASDGTATSDPVTVSLNVASVNVMPMASDDNYIVGEDETLILPSNPTAALTMVSEPGDYIGQGLTYDLDQTNGTFTAVRNFDNGVRVHYTGAPGDWWTLEFAAPGEVPLMPGVYTDATRFPFQSPNVPGLSISGQGRGSNTLTGQFTVHEVVYGPTGDVLVFDASFEQHSEGHDPALTGHVRFVADGAGGVLANDADADGDPLSAVLVSGPSHGALTLAADGRLEYTPDVDFYGIDTFTYRTSDGTVLSDTATVTISVLPANDAPVANDQSASTPEDTPLIGNVTALDVDGDELQFTQVSAPTNGTLILNADGTFTYTPDSNFHGTDEFTFVADDSTTASQPATVTITVDPVNDAPVISGATFNLAENSAVGTPVGTVVASDVDGDALTYQIVGGNASGAFTVDAVTGVIQVADSAPLDFETTPVFNLTVEAADPGGLTATAGVTVMLTDVSETLAVSIDVRPGDSTNTISSNGNGRTEVAILSTAGFDAHDIDVATLRFGRTGTENSLRWKKGQPVHHYEDVNGDGLLDLVVKFERDLMGFFAGGTTAHLSGQMLDGTEIAGEDDVNLTGNWPSE